MLEEGGNQYIPKVQSKDAFAAVLSTEGRVVGPCWEKLKPKGPKRPIKKQEKESTASAKTESASTTPACKRNFVIVKQVAGTSLQEREIFCNAAC